MAVVLECDFYRRPDGSAHRASVVPGAQDEQGALRLAAWYKYQAGAAGGGAAPGYVLTDRPVLDGRVTCAGHLHSSPSGCTIPSHSICKGCRACKSTGELHHYQCPVA